MLHIAVYLINITLSCNVILFGIYTCSSRTRRQTQMSMPSWRKKLGCDHTWPVLPEDYPKESSEVPTDRFILPLDATGHINHKLWKAQKSNWTFFFWIY